MECHRGSFRTRCNIELFKLGFSTDPQTLRTVQFSGGSFQKIPERWTTPDVFVKSFVFGVSLGFLKLPLFTFDTVGAKRMYRKEGPKIWTCSDYVSCVVS